MADITKTTKELKLVARFADADTRTLTQTNPRDSITAAEINEFGAWCKEHQPIIGDKGSADFVGFTSPANIIEKSVTQLDLS